MYKYSKSCRKGFTQCICCGIPSRNWLQHLTFPSQRQIYAHALAHYSMSGKYVKDITFPLRYCMLNQPEYHPSGFS